MIVDVDPDRTALVALYGSKPTQLVDRIMTLQSTLSAALEEPFRPRPLGDVHSTIIGLDMLTAGTIRRDIPGVLDFLVEEFQREPFTVQYGGYSPQDRRMLSRGESLYKRSLVVNADKVVLIGWPVVDIGGTNFTNTRRLASIRRSCEQFGVLHRYHTDPTVDDLDSYMVVGTLGIDTTVDPRLVREVVSQALEEPTRVTFDEHSLSIVQYIDFALPRATSAVWPLVEAAE